MTGLVTAARSGSGLFVVFEGGDGVGKSTQAELLCAALASRGIAYVRTFEPGDEAEITVQRGDATLTVQVTFGRRS